MERVLLTLLNVLHFQMEARYEDANCLRTLPIQQLNDLDKQDVVNTAALLIWCEDMLGKQTYSSKQVA